MKRDRSMAAIYPGPFRESIERVLALSTVAGRFPFHSHHSRMSSLRFTRLLAAAALMQVVASVAQAQENYEIQVYPSETVPRGVTMFELHSNYTRIGCAVACPDGMLPTNHAIHETLEITHGWNDWSELGF